MDKCRLVHLEPPDAFGESRRQQMIEELKPIPMLLACPFCGFRHIDEGEFATKVHHTHACQACGMVWRPAIVPTCGVQFLPGFKNEDQSHGGDDVISRYHVEHAEHRFVERGSSIRQEWWEVYEDGKWLCQCCDADDAERIRTALDRLSPNLEGEPEAQKKAPEAEAPPPRISRR